jgi:hypothetical protein
MRLKNSLVRVRDIGALIATRARRDLANRGSKTAEIDARRRKVTPRNKAISAPICITSYGVVGAQCPKNGPFKGHGVRRIPFRGNPG